MKLVKKFLISSVLIFACGFTFAQQSQVQTVGDDNEEVETSVESAYLNNMMAETIAAMADSPDLATKRDALRYLNNQIDKGNTSPAIIETLDNMAGEGLRRQTRKKNRVTNNWPEVRRDACYILAKVPTVHSKNTLVQIAKEDKEPMVGAAAIMALGEIAVEVGCVDEAIDAISFFQKKNFALNPTSSFAHEVLFAYEKLMDSASPAQRHQMIEDIAAIANNPNYHNGLVELKARTMLMEYSGMTAGSSDSTSEK